MPKTTINFPFLFLPSSLFIYFLLRNPYSLILGTTTILIFPALVQLNFFFTFPLYLSLSLWDTAL